MSDEPGPAALSGPSAAVSRRPASLPGSPALLSNPPPAVFARLGAMLVLVWLAFGVWGYGLALGDDVRGVIVPVVQVAAAFTLYGLRSEPTMVRWRGLLAVQAGALALIGGLSAVSLLTVLVAG